jgi:colicin import membrane protein
MRSVPPLSPNTPAIAADIITPSEFLRLKQGSENAKKLETKAKEEPKEDDSKNDTKKPNDAPPPPQQQELAKAEPPPEPEPPKAAEPEKPDVDPIAKKIEESPPPAPTPSPSAEDKKKLEQKLEEQRQAEEAKQKAEEEAKAKAEEEAKQKAAEEAKKKAEEEARKKAEAKKKKEEAERKKKLAEALKKKKQEEARKKAEAAKKKFDPSRIASILAKETDDASPKALIDKDPRKKGQQAAGTSKTAEDIGQEAGTATGTDTVLSLREQDMLKGMLKSQLNGCWRPPGTGGGSDVPVVSLHWELNPDGSLVGQPRVISAPSTTAGEVYAEAALRAVRMCAPFRLPPDKYAAWKTIEWTFDPREML